MNLENLNGKVIWVIGGAGYLGQSTVKMLLDYGAKVLCVELDNRAEEFGKSIKANENFIPFSVDVRDEKETESFVREGIQSYGVPDGLVVLTFGASGKSLEELSGADFNDANYLNLTSTFLITRAVASEMAERSNGSIVLFSSMYGMISPYPEIYEPPMTVNPVEYGTGKAGIIQLTKYLAVYYAKKGVRVNCISPGPFPNHSTQKEHPDFINRLKDKVPMGRIGHPKEVAGAALFLLSDFASFITGHNLVVDGGWTCW